MAVTRSNVAPRGTGGSAPAPPEPAHSSRRPPRALPGPARSPAPRPPLTAPPTAAPSGGRAARAAPPLAPPPSPDPLRQRREGRGRTCFSAERCRPPEPAARPAGGGGLRGAVPRQRRRCGFCSCRGGSVGVVPVLATSAAVRSRRPPPRQRRGSHPPLSLRPPLPLPGGLGLRLRVGFPLSLEAPNMYSIVCAERHQVMMHDYHRRNSCL